MDENAFVFHDGQKASTPAELLHILKRIEPSLAESHLSAQHNDYANWVQAVHQDDKLAAALRSCRNVSEVIQVLRQNTMPKRKTQTPPKASERSMQTPPPSKPASQPARNSAKQPQPDTPPPFRRTSMSSRDTQAQKDAPVEHPPQVEEEDPVKKQEFTPKKRRSPIGWDKPLRGDPIRDLARKGLHEHPHIREFIIGLALGIIIGALATALAI